MSDQNLLTRRAHRAIVTAATLASPTTVTLDMRFQATHNHTLTLTAAGSDIHRRERACAEGLIHRRWPQPHRDV